MPKEPKVVELEELEPGLLIDENRLEQACSRHPDLFYRVSKRLAAEISYRDSLKEDLATTEAEVDAEIRQEAAEQEAKTTEKEIESRKRTDKRVEKARNQLLDANLAVGQWAALKDAFTQRSYMLKTLGELYVSNYYSDTSSVGTAGGNAQAERAKREMQNERVRRNK